MARFANNRMLLKGFDIKSRLTRNYAQGEIYAHVVGYMGSISSNDYQRFDPSFYTGKEQIGKSAIEREYEHILRGIPGKQKLLVNVRGRVMDEIEKEAFESGNNIVLTLNSELQKTAYDSMEGKKGSVVAMDPRNGEILAMISVPSFDPTAISLGLSQSEFRKLSNNKKRPLFNRAIAGQYPPGSTVKPMLALGALDMGIVDSEHFHTCEGEFRLPNYSRPFGDWAVHGSVNTKRAIQASCDVYFYESAVEMGIERMSAFLKKFNLGEETKLDLGSEKAGVVPNQEWKKIGAGLPVHEARGSMVVDIGGGTSEIAVLSLNGIVYGNSVKVGGDTFDEAIINFIRRNYGILIGEATAEKIKHEIGSAYPSDTVSEISVKGRNLSEGVPRTFTLNSNEILDSLQEPLQAIANALKSALEQTPPELGSDIAERGIVLTGGGALLQNIEKLLAEETGLPVLIAENPLTCVARGGGRIIDILDEQGADFFELT